MLLSDDTLAEGVGEAEYGLNFVLDHASHGNAGPVRHHGGNRVCIATGQNQWPLSLQLFQFGQEFLELIFEIAALGI